MRRRRLWIAVLGILGIIAVVVLWPALPGRSTFTVGPETTYVTGPLNKHGDVDYVAAFNERLRKGVTPENNANVLIWQALGPRPEGGTMPAEYFEWLGAEPPPEEGEYLVSWQNYMREPWQNAEGIQRDAKGNFDLRVPNRPWTAREKPALAGWLKQNERPLGLARDASWRPEYYNPLVPKRTEDWSPGLLSAMLPTLQRCRELAAALACRAMLRVAEGNVEEAWQDLLACHRLGRLVARGGSLIEMLVGIAIEQYASNADVGFLDQADLTSEQVLACWEDLAKLSPLPCVADQVDFRERFLLLDSILLSARQGPEVLTAGSDGMPPKGKDFTIRWTRGINWDPAFRNANRWFDRCAAVLRITDRKERAQELAAFDRDLKALKQQAYESGAIEKWFMGPQRRGEMMGNILIPLLMPACNKVLDASERHEQCRRNLHLAFALAAYQRDRGRYPDGLNELVPTYLKRIPDDLFSDRPPIYRREDKGYLLYSVGLNGLDDGGRGNGDEPPGDDLCIRIPVPEPRGKK